MITNKKSVYYLRLFADLFSLNLSFFISAVLAQSLRIFLSRPHMFVLLAILNFVWYFFSNVTNFYEDITTKSFSYQFRDIIKNLFAQIIFSIFFIFIAKEDLFTRNFILIYSVLLLILVSIRIQIIKQLVRRIRVKEKNVRNVLIIGAGQVGQNFRELIQTREDFGYKFIGYLDDQQSEGNNDLLGNISNLEKIVSEKNINVVVIALSFYASTQLDDIMKTCNRYGLRVHIIPDYFRFLSKKYQVNMIGDFPVITVRDEPLAEAHWRFIKRTGDIIFSFLVIILLFSWLFPLLIIINKLTSTGPLFFIQDRVGADDRIFRCFKFRTMHIDEKKSDAYQPIIENDPRITKIGRLLRKSNIDELPQFLNVLKGEMSIVGPRPHSVPFHEEYAKMVEEIKIRTWVKPGITGWAQVHGYRGDVINYDENKKRTQKRIEYDLWYIENWSLWLDIQIILLTIWQMIKGDTKGI